MRFETYQVEWCGQLRIVDSHREGIQFKMHNPPIPPSKKLFHVCIKFQEYVQAKRIENRDIWKDHLDGENDFLERESTLGS